MRRGDSTKVARDSEDPNDYSAMIFINEFWRKNYYGELYLYVVMYYVILAYVYLCVCVLVYVLFSKMVYKLNNEKKNRLLKTTGKRLFQDFYSLNTK